MASYLLPFKTVTNNLFFNNFKIKNFPLTKAIKTFSVSSIENAGNTASHLTQFSFKNDEDISIVSVNSDQTRLAVVTLQKAANGYIQTLHVFDLNNMTLNQVLNCNKQINLSLKKILFLNLKFPKPLNKIILSQNGIAANEFILSPVDPDLYVLCMINGLIRMGKLSENDIKLEKAFNAVCGK